jgi:tetratricopeptide (TPR) repeat protein
MRAIPFLICFSVYASIGSAVGAGIPTKQDGDLCVAKNGTDAAIAACSRIIASNTIAGGPLADVYTFRGTAHHRKGELDQAISDYNRALKLDPKSATALANRATAYFDKRDFDRALAGFTELSRLFPKDPMGLIGRGKAYTIKGDAPRAIASFKEALKLDPKNKMASDMLAAYGVPVTSDAIVGTRAPSITPSVGMPSALSPAAAPAPGQAIGKRVALVIGNGRYEAMQQIPNPPNDAADIARAMTALGFKVTLVVDAKRDAMEEALASFAREARQSDTALVFYAGHGFQHLGVNYLAPIDARIGDETDLRKFVRVQSILDDLQNVKGARILILDACRDNEAIKQLAAILPKSRSAAVRSGLAGERAEGVMIAYATQPDRIAADGDGRNSPFTAALLKNLPAPGVELRTMFTRVRSEVLRATGGVQRPETSDSLDGEVVLSMP